jgi:Xaa-Pro aminopeptidase
MNLVQRLASRIESLPVVRQLSPAGTALPTAEGLASFLNSQRLAVQAAREIAKLLQPGWTEKRTAQLLDTYLRDYGVHNFFHHSFVWFGDRTRFAGVRSYSGYSPSNRVLRPGDAVILDVAPIVEGAICDIGYSFAFGNNPEVEAGLKFLRQLKEEIPKLFTSYQFGADIWREVDNRIVEAGYENIHEQYPFSVLGHRVHIVPDHMPEMKLLNFGWQSYWSLLSRGLFGQLLNQQHEGRLHGLWAIEPHIGGNGWGAKFEEILVVDQDGARWLETDLTQSSLAYP